MPTVRCRRVTVGKLGPLTQSLSVVAAVAGEFLARRSASACAMAVAAGDL